MTSARHAIFLIVFLGIGWAGQASGQGVRVWEGTLELPTYALGEEDRNPPFPLVARSNIYPYTMLDDLTGRRETRTYRAIFLENEFLKATVLPELGGRLFSLYDKASGREVFYRNNVVKYGLVALRGAWISGGIEFNFPDGHTVVTVSPVASTARQNPDGSATVVVGDVDQVTGMHWQIALTLRPGEARLEQQVTLFNATPVANRYWYWATAAVPATEDMQFIYPMREANPHARTEIRTYPVWNSVDWSWYKNIRRPTSLFGRQVRRDFFGAFYHSADYGVVHVADFHEVPGKKIWSWGVAGDGLIWTDLLTDSDGPYNEIQSGRYETQLSYEFMPPRRVESWTEYWYPVRGLGDGLVEANRELALNVRFIASSGMMSQRVIIIVCPTVAFPGLKVRAKLGQQVLREFGPVSLEPLTPRRFTLSTEDLEVARRQLAVEISSADGKPLLRWSAADPIDGNPDFVVAAGTNPFPAKPIEKMTIEELFLRGVDLEKEGRTDDATETYQRVLERDSHFIPALLKLAWRDYRSADLQKAETLVVRALRRDNTNPAAYYAAGLIYRTQERWNLGEDSFWESIRYGGQQAPAFAQLGEMAIRQKKHEEAADLLRRGLSYNPGDALLMTDLAVALRLAGKLDEAAKVIEQTAENVPLLPFALAEYARVAGARGGKPSADVAWKRWTQSLARHVQNYLEVAAWYRTLDDLPSSDAVLQAAFKDLPRQLVSPLVYYYLAANARRREAAQEVERYAAQAASASCEKVFPNRLADALVLTEAIDRNPADSHAKYFLGNFLFAHGRYEDAARLWSQALEQGFEYSVLLRNLGVHAWRVKKDLTAAAGFYERAIRLAPNDFRLYNDLDEIYARLGDRERRVKLFADAPAMVLERDTVRVRRVLLFVEQRQYDEALAILRDHRFKPWEGGHIVRQMFVLANLEKGKQALQAQNTKDAEQAFRRALEYPPNLGIGKPDKPSDEEPLYWLGEVLQAQGNVEAARAAWQEACGEGMTSEGAGRIFRALAMRRLGRTADAQELLGKLAAAPSKEGASASDYYIAGLVDLLENRKEQAKGRFRHALELDPSLWQARIQMERAM